MNNFLTIDVEDYYMVSAFESFVPKAGWSSYESRIEIGTRRVLDLLAESGTRATFFTLGWVAERYPDLVRAIQTGGHEVACHGHMHELLYNIGPDRFREDVRKAKKVLEDVTGAAVRGYRAPSFSLTNETLWMLDILGEEGFAYDSSLLPAPHARGGINDPSLGLAPFQFHGMMEFPISTMRVFGKTIPFSGGGYFRLFPYAMIRKGIRNLNQKNIPAMVYWHPWEFDADQPRLPARGLNRFRHYVNIAGNERKARRLLNEFSFLKINSFFESDTGK